MRYPRFDQLFLRLLSSTVFASQYRLGCFNEFDYIRVTTKKTDMKLKPAIATIKRARRVSVQSYKLKSAGHGMITFDSVTIEGRKPSAESVKANVEQSTNALSRLSSKLTRPGFRLSRKKGVPRFSVDENDPTIFIRVLDGRTDRGRMINGEFEPVR